MNTLQAADAAGCGRVSTLAPPSHSFTLSLFLARNCGLTIKSCLDQLVTQTSVCDIVNSFMS